MGRSKTSKNSKQSRIKLGQQLGFTHIWDHKMEVLNMGGMGLHSWLIGVSTTRTQVVQLPIAQLVVQMDITMI